METEAKIGMNQEKRITRCSLCHRVQEHPEPSPEAGPICERCGAPLTTYQPRNLYRTRSLALAAAALYVPANVLPIALVDYLGQHREMTIVSGIGHLFSSGVYFVGTLVFTTSFITPMMKIIGLLYLAFAPTGGNLRWKRRLYEIIQAVNPWNAMEICLLSILLALVNFGVIAQIAAGPGAMAFAGVVILTTAASVTFDPAALRYGKGEG